MLPALALAVLSSAVTLAGTMQPERTGQMAVVFPPLTDERTAWAIVREAGGMIVSPTNLPNVVVAYAPDDQFQTRIRQLGALFFVAARGLCGPAILQDA